MSLICHLERTMGTTYQHCAQTRWQDSEQLMNEDEMYLPELDDIQPDVVLAAAVDLKLDIKDFV